MVVGERFLRNKIPETLKSDCLDAQRGRSREHFNYGKRRARPAVSSRQDRWDEHFERNTALIVGRSAVGRATVGLLKMNAADRRRLRER
jgi:hypothetical protein